MHLRMLLGGPSSLETRVVSYFNRFSRLSEEVVSAVAPKQRFVALFSHFRWILINLQARISWRDQRRVNGAFKRRLDGFDLVFALLIPTLAERQARDSVFT